MSLSPASRLIFPPLQPIHSWLKEETVGQRLGDASMQGCPVAFPVSNLYIPGSEKDTRGSHPGMIISLRALMGRNQGGKLQLTSGSSSASCLFFVGNV